jgi:hypothetical protein
MIKICILSIPDTQQETRLFGKVGFLLTPVSPISSQSSTQTSLEKADLIPYRKNMTIEPNSTITLDRRTKKSILIIH